MTGEEKRALMRERLLAKRAQRLSAQRRLEVIRPPCMSEGAVLEYCKSCNSAAGENRHVRDCDVHERCTRGFVSNLVRACSRCPDYKPAEPVTKEQSAPTPSPPPRRKGTMLTWAYGVTTVPERRDTLLPRTLESLKVAGFDTPTLFVDGDADPTPWRDKFGLEVVCRHPRIRTFGNWALSLAELYIRAPRADRYAIFQDDFVCSKGLRRYLDETAFPPRGYLNLYTFPDNQRLSPGDLSHGFYPSNQKGKGAVALVFDGPGVVTLLGHTHMLNRPKDANRGHKAVDGGIVTAMLKAGYREYVHTPSLVQHTGMRSSMGNPKHPLATSFKGEDFDLTTLLGGGGDGS